MGFPLSRADSMIYSDVYFLYAATRERSAELVWATTVALLLNV